MKISRLISIIFHPTYYPTVGMLILLTMSYLNMLPWSLKAWLLGLVYIFTVGLPFILTALYRRFSCNHQAANHRARRTVPYCIHLVCYMACMYIMNYTLMPRCISAIIFVSLMVQVCCAIINLWWKISMHSAGSGAIIGAVVAYAELFGFNPVWWLCAALLLSGLVMSSRLLLRRHTLAQVLCGTLIGIVCAVAGVLV